ncbi:Alpha-dioxygenase 1, partial [Nymphaea thermarum]
QLEVDRFFTSYFNEETYTKKGLQWVNTSESLKDVIKMHYPKITETWLNVASAFSVWDAPSNAENAVPLYLHVSGQSPNFSPKKPKQSFLWCWVV